MLKTLGVEKLIFIIIAAAMVVGVGIWIYLESKPLPTYGQQLPDLGRTHVPIGTPEFYNSNPPTSGPHYEVWTTANIYDNPLDDRNLIHSLEHGYIIMSYNCDVQAAHNLNLNEASMSAQTATDSATLSQPFREQSCTDLKNNLTQIFTEKGKRKLIVVPRPSLKYPIALTAWTRLENLEQFDKERISRFIDAYRDQGPEKTMEPAPL